MRKHKVLTLRTVHLQPTKGCRFFQPAAPYQWPGGQYSRGVMFENFIQSEANLVQLFILVLKHRKTIFKIFYLKGPFFRPLKNVKMQFCDFSKKYNFFLGC